MNLPDKSHTQANIELLTKKISILENEISSLKARSPRINDRLALENLINALKDKIKNQLNSNKEIQKIIDEGQKKDKKDAGEHLWADLRAARNKLKNIEEKFNLGLKNHEKNLKAICDMEEQISKLQENRVDILKIEPNISSYTMGIADLKVEFAELEKKRKIQDQQMKSEIDQLQSDIKVRTDHLAELRKELKLKVHELSSNDHEINELKRKLRSTSARKFNNSPNIGRFEDLAAEYPGSSGQNKLSAVKSESRIPSSFKRPPRPDSNSPAAQRIKILKSETKPNI